jgi:hypothetical protein
VWTESQRYSDKNKFKDYRRKWRREFASCLANLWKMIDHLEAGYKPATFKSGFYHVEKRGVYAIAQSKVPHAQETRFYIYPDEVTSTLYILTIGTKKEQSEDLKYCYEIADAIHKSHEADGGRPAASVRTEGADAPGEQRPAQENTGEQDGAKKGI